MKQTISLLLLISLKTYSQQNLVFKDLKIPHPTAIDSTAFNWNRNQLKKRSLTSKEEEFYYWVNYSRNNPAKFFDSAVIHITEIYPQLKGKNLESLRQDLKNAVPLPLLSLNDTLIRIAKLHADDIVSHNSSPSHNSTSGETFIDRFQKAHLKKCGAENISFSGGDGDPLFILVLLYLDINVPDLGHRKTLLSSTYSETGIGISNYKNGNIFLVEDFACSQK